MNTRKPAAIIKMFENVTSINKVGRFIF